MKPSTPSIFVFLTIVIVLMVALAGCSHKQTAHATTPATTTLPPPAAAAATPTAKADIQPASAHVGVSADLIAACRLHFAAPAEAPKFDFDTSTLGPDDRDVLSKVAECLVSGPLAGRAIALVGRADPRGTSEYNLALGQRRAETVAAYLERLGVETAKVADSTRGALDATGKDESSWRVDRRVDLQLAD